jgi:hypothetical protein
MAQGEAPELKAQYKKKKNTPQTNLKNILLCKRGQSKSSFIWNSSKAKRKHK